MSWGDGPWGSGIGGLVGGITGQLGRGPIHITQQGYDQARAAQLRQQFIENGLVRTPKELLDLQRAEHHRQHMQQMIGQSYPLGSWAGKIEREIRKHLPSKAYDVFIQRRPDRHAYMARIIRGGARVAEVDVPCELLRYPNRGEWKLELLTDLSDDIEARGR